MTSIRRLALTASAISTLAAALLLACRRASASGLSYRSMSLNGVKRRSESAPAIRTNASDMDR